MRRQQLSLEDSADTSVYWRVGLCVRPLLTLQLREKAAVVELCTRKGWMFVSLGFLPANASTIFISQIKARNQKHPFTISTDSRANWRGQPHRTPCGFLVVARGLSIIIDGHSPSPFTHFLVLAKGFSVACHLWPNPILILMLNIWPRFGSQSVSCAEFETLFVCRFDTLFIQ